MNENVSRTQMEYRNIRELVSFSIFDIESRLVQLAGEGRIWRIKEMNDITESETIIINHYLNEKRELQIYDLVQSTALTKIPHNVIHQNEQTKFQTKQKSIKD